MNRSRSRWVGGLAGIFLALTMAGTAAAYWAQTPATVTIFGPHGNIKCGQWVTFRAVIRDHDGDRIANGGPVIWSFDTSPSASDQIDPTQSNTNAHGRAETNVMFACVPGDRVLRATANTVSGTIDIRVHVKDEFDDQAVSAVGAVKSSGSGGASNQSAANAAAARATGVLPNTSASPGVTLPTIIALVALLVGASLVVRRTATHRR